MSWSRNLATGLGAVAYRLQIEGLGYEFVSYNEMEKTTSDGRVRFSGLIIDELMIEEDVDIAHGDIEAGSITARVLDTLKTNYATKAFAWRPDTRATLTADLAVGGTTATVDSTVGFAVGDVIHIGTEALYVDAVASGTTLTVTRAYWNTIDQAHYAGNTGRLSGSYVYRTRPTTIIGRRVRLFAYGAGDDPQSDGTLIWRGVCLTDAALDDDGSSFTVHIDPHVALLNQDMGADLEDPVSPRGIYYPYVYALRIEIDEGGTPYYKTFAGFYRDNAELGATVQAWFDSVVSSLTLTRIEFVAETNDWYLRLQPSAGTVALDYLAFRITSVIDGGASTTIVDEDSPTRSWGRQVDGSDLVSGDWYEVRLDGGPEGARGVPRGYYGTTDYGPNSLAGLSGSELPDTAAADAPTSRVYLGGTLVVTTADELRFDFGDDSGMRLRTGVSAVSASERWAESAPGAAFFTFTPANLPEISAQRLIATGGLRDFRDALVALTPSLANLGALPFVTATDFGEWSAAPDAERSRPIAASRSYVNAQPVNLKEFLAEECKLRGLFPHLDIQGKITLSPIVLPSDVSVPDHVLTEDDILISDGWPTWERIARGSINAVRLLTGYSARNDEHEGPTYNVQDQGARAERKKSLTLEIAPYSQEQRDAAISFGASTEQLIDLAAPVIGVFGGDYAMVSLDVPLTRFDILVGDVVEVTVPHLPNVLTGGRGATVRGMVTGRRWDMRAGRGTLTMIVGLARATGWAPSVGVASQSGATTEWTLTVAKSDPLGTETDRWASGEALSDHFVQGYRIRIREWDDPAPTVIEGEVTDVDDGASAIAVALDASWTPGSSLWVLEYAAAGTIDSDSTQAQYAYLGGADGFITWTDGDARASEYTA